jgi:hypothetical protein
MQRVQNEWVSDEVSKLIITSAKTGTVTAYFDGININNLRHLRWCYEQSKGHIYATDLTAEVPKLLNCGTHKVYLWKYLAYQLTGIVATAWVREDLFLFRYGYGSVFDSAGNVHKWLPPPSKTS